MKFVKHLLAMRDWACSNGHVNPFYASHCQACGEARCG